MSIVNEPVARYFPPSSGHYAIKPGFYRLGHDFGNGAADHRLFQLDRQFSHYRRAKQSARSEDLDKYLCFTDAGRTWEPMLNRFVIAQLCAEYPEQFHLQQTGDRQQLDCHLTGDSLVFAADGRYLDYRPGEQHTAPPYRSGLDALAMQIQEDLALVCLNGAENRLCAIHLCQPNHWAPRDKIGRDFIGYTSRSPVWRESTQKRHNCYRRAFNRDPSCALPGELPPMIGSIIILRRHPNGKPKRGRGVTLIRPIRLRGSGLSAKRFMVYPTSIVFCSSSGLTIMRCRIYHRHSNACSVRRWPACRQRVSGTKGSPGGTTLCRSGCADSMKHHDSAGLIRTARTSQGAPCNTELAVEPSSRPTP